MEVDVEREEKQPARRRRSILMRTLAHKQGRSFVIARRKSLPRQTPSSILNARDVQRPNLGLDFQLVVEVVASGALWNRTHRRLQGGLDRATCKPSANL